MIKDYIDKFFNEVEMSEVNKNILRKYFNKMITTGRAEKTIRYNLEIMKFVLRHVKTDLDKLTTDDIDEFDLAISTWTCVKKKGERSKSSKAQFQVGFKRFLRWYAKTINL